MHTLESTRDALLDDLDLDADLLGACADLPLEDFYIEFDPLDLPDLAEVASLAPRREVGAARATPSPARGDTSESVRITLRVPRAVLDGFKTHAAGASVGYQTLIVRALREWLLRSAGRTIR